MKRRILVRNAAFALGAILLTARAGATPRPHAKASRGDDRYFNMQTRSFERPPLCGPRAGQDAQP